MSLAGCTALVTGGASGLGRAVSERLAAQGCAVAVGYSSSQGQADAFVTSLEESGKRAQAIGFDVGDWDQIRDAVRKIGSTMGPVDILVNSAGITKFVGDGEAILQTDWERVVRVNLGGTMGAIQAVVPAMQARGTGAIVNISSIAGIIGVGSSLAYIASKAAVIQLTAALARDLAPAIRVNAVAPGSMPTTWYERYYPEGTRPLEGAMTPVAQVADAVIWLLLNDAVTGEVLVIDRGESLAFRRRA